MNTPWPFEVSLKKEDILKVWRNGWALWIPWLCCNHNNNQQQYTANVHTAYVANEGITERFANWKREEKAVVDEAHFPWTV